MSNAAQPVILSFFRPDPVAQPAIPGGMTGTPLTLERAVQLYLQHLQLRASRGKLSAEHLDNVTRSLRTFVAAWRVVFADGRQAILPAASEAPAPKRGRRRPPPRTAADQAAAVAWAQELFPGDGDASASSVNGKTPIGEAEADDLERWILANPQWRTENAKANNVAAILNCFGWLEDEPKGCRSPYRRSRAPKFERETRRDATVQEYEVMIGPGCCFPMRAALWALWHVEGMRTCELYKLRWSEFRWRGDDDSTIEMHKHKTRGTSGKPKLLPLTPRTREFFAELRRLAGVVDADGHVFVNSEGGGWTRHAFDHHFERRRDFLGLPKDLTPYCLRHGFATQAVEAGCDKDDIRALLGHAAGSRILEKVYSKAEQHAEHVCRRARRVEERVEALRETRKRKTPEAVQGELF